MDFLFAVRTLQKGNAYAILAQTMVLYYRKRKIGSHTDFKSFPVNPLAGRLTACFFLLSPYPAVRPCALPDKLWLFRPTFQDRNAPVIFGKVRLG